MPNDPLAIERAIRSQLKIPEEAQHVVILGAAAHMDWDWLYPFQSLVTGVEGYNTSANDIITQGIDLIRQSSKNSNPYYYSICEMSFFRAVAELPGNEDLLKNFAIDINDKLGIQGGGITSPDNFLPHGEAFIRNYLLGKTWLKSANIPLPQGFCYIPDDFGSDSQLPVVVQAMGFTGVSFARIPALLASNIEAADFVWQASDASSAVAHWMPGGTYCQGSGINNNGNPLGNLQGYINTNAPLSPTPYVYVPCGCDFTAPIPNLVDIANNWNQANYHGESGDYFVVVATLGQYISLIETYTDASIKHAYQNYQILQTGSFQPYPYWTGYYASRPANKILHARTVKTLLAAETFGKIADILQRSDSMAWNPVQVARQASINQGWEALVPSTHHDYICGTAVDTVYTGEQLPLLAGACTVAASARDVAISEIANLVLVNPTEGETPVVIFNSQGIHRTAELVELAAMPGVVATSVRDADNNQVPVQIAADGKLLFQATASSLGYSTMYLNTTTSTCHDPVQVVESSDSSQFTLSNQQLSVTISRDANWGIASFKVGETEFIPNDHQGNDLTFYRDDGGLYQFGNEYPPTTFERIPNATTLTPGNATIIESGPLRTRVSTVVSFLGADGCAATYTREYTLITGESQLRISCTGSAPINPQWGAASSNGYSVMVRFPWAGSGSRFPLRMKLMARGTAFHWDAADPAKNCSWQPPIFVATHDYVIPQASSTDTGNPVIYHEDMPAWAIDDTGCLMGCLFRNNPISRHGAGGSDGGVHTHVYAVRAPDAFVPTDLRALLESRRFQNPLLAAYTNVPAPDYPPTPKLTFPESFSLARVTAGEAMITAAKGGQFSPDALVLRLYQPTNTPQKVSISLHTLVAKKLTVRQATALEDMLEGQPLLIQIDNQVAFTMDHALTSLYATTS